MRWKFRSIENSCSNEFCVVMICEWSQLEGSDQISNFQKIFDWKEKIFLFPIIPSGQIRSKLLTKSQRDFLSSSIKFSRFQIDSLAFLPRKVNKKKKRFPVDFSRSWSMIWKSSCLLSDLLIYQESHLLVYHFLFVTPFSFFIRERLWKRKKKKNSLLVSIRLAMFMTRAHRWRIWPVSFFFFSRSSFFPSSFSSTLVDSFSSSSAHALPKKKTFFFFFIVLCFGWWWWWWLLFAFVRCVDIVCVFSAS